MENDSEPLCMKIKLNTLYKMENEDSATDSKKATTNFSKYFPPCLSNKIIY